MRNKPLFLSIDFITGEDIQAINLPVLKVAESNGEYLVVEGEQLINSALVESIKQLGQPSVTTVVFAVEIVPASRRTRGGRR